MLRSVNKYKLYLYVVFFVFLSSVLNFQILFNYKDKFSIKKINIYGLSYNEKKIIENEVNYLKGTNFFKLNKYDILEKLNKFNFLENIYVNKIVPSALNINLTKTAIIGKTLIKGKIYFVGENGKLINPDQVFSVNDTATLYGEFKVKEYLNLIKILNDQKFDTSKIKEYYFYKNKRWDLFFSNGQRLMLPSKKIPEAIKIYKELLINKKLINTKIVDLRVTNQVILTKNNE